MKIIRHNSSGTFKSNRSMKRSFSGALLLLAIVLCMTVECDGFAQVEISLKESAIARGNVVLLKDIAEIKGKDLDLLNELNTLILGKSPKAGISEEYGKYEVLWYLKRNRINTKPLVFSGADRTRVSSPTRKISSDEILERAKAFLLQKIGLTDPNVLLEPRTTCQEVILPEGKVDFVFRILAGEGTESVLLNVKIRQKKENKKIFNLTFHVRTFEKVWAASHLIAKGSLISENDLYLVRKERKKGMNGQTDNQYFIGKTALRDIRKGALMQTKMVGSPVTVRKGQMVNIRIQSELLNITVSGKAMEDGYPGKYIQAKNIDTGRLVTGRVGDNGTVFVQSR
ncbi:MAG: flagellar basal body P-ring formation protein FlgA [Candidatus Aureabacteria bacterium]|nr:flagellar basal body P-ring formation protein FlgA [Candidatus Auribacterota bacterium]